MVVIGARNRRSQRSCRGKIFMLIRQTCQEAKLILAGGPIATNCERVRFPILTTASHRGGKVAPIECDLEHPALAERTYLSVNNNQDATDIDSRYSGKSEAKKKYDHEKRDTYSH
jgi:hypothetical protein